MASISIKYSEGNKKNLQYKSVDITYDDSTKKKSFNSGNFVKDWYDGIRFLIINDITDSEYLVHSSSVNHFIMDGAPYDSAYLHIDKDSVPILKYVDESDPHYLHSQRDIYEGGIELFVPESTTPTWIELCEMCGNKKKKKTKSKNK